MKVNPVELVAVDKLNLNSANPKAQLGLKYKRGLRESLSRWGFAGLLVVASNADGTFEVLDGNTRLDELQREGVESIPCVVMHNMRDDERRKFALAHDRHRKEFDENAVLSQLEALASRGEDLKQLAVLSGKENLERLLAESSKQTHSTAATTGSAAATMASLVLYGPAAEVKTIQGLLKSIKGRLSTLEKVRKALADADTFLEWDDPKVLTTLLATIGRLSQGEER